MVPFGASLNVDNLALVMYFLTQKLPRKEKTALAKRLQITSEEIQPWARLESVAKPVEKALKSSGLNRPSRVYETLRGVPGERVLFLYLHSADRIVHDRSATTSRNTFWPPRRSPTRTWPRPGSSRHPYLAKVKDEMIAAKLDGRNWKPEQSPSGAAAALAQGIHHVRRGIHDEGWRLTAADGRVRQSRFPLRRSEVLHEISFTLHTGRSSGCWVPTARGKPPPSRSSRAYWRPLRDAFRSRSSRAGKSCRRETADRLRARSGGAV
jgi:hypothetical protein